MADKKAKLISLLAFPLLGKTIKREQYTKCKCGRALYSVKECERGTCATCNR